MPRFGSFKKLSKSISNAPSGVANNAQKYMPSQSSALGSNNSTNLFNREQSMMSTNSTSSIPSMSNFTSSIDIGEIIDLVKNVVLKNNIVLAVIAVWIVLIILFMMINTVAKSNILQWFIWIFLFIYLAFFVVVQFYLVPSDNFNPWASALVAALFIYLFPSPLFNTRKNKSSTQWISIGFTLLILVTSFLMLCGYTSRFFRPADGPFLDPRVLLFNFALPITVLVIPPFYYWAVFY